MANYAHTKDIIAQNIYTNHEGRVTAEMVKTAANEIVKTLIDGGYLYAGVAKLTPTQTNPGSPDANVFYIATEPGTYTNFVGAGGSLVVADGEVAIFKFNGSWSKETTGAATAAQVNQLGQLLLDVNDLSSAIYVKKYIASDGTLISNEHVATTDDFIPFTVKRGILKTSTKLYGAIVGFYDSSHTFIGRLTADTYTPGTDYDGYLLPFESLAGTAYIKITVQDGLKTTAVDLISAIKPTILTICDLQEMKQEIGSIISSLDTEHHYKVAELTGLTWEKKYINSSGGTTSSNYVATCAEYVRFSDAGGVVLTSTKLLALVIGYYDYKKTFISRDTADTSTPGTTYDGYRYLFTCPTGTAFIRISVQDALKTIAVDLIPNIKPTIAQEVTLRNSVPLLTRTKEEADAIRGQLFSPSPSMRLRGIEWKACGDSITRGAQAATGSTTYVKLCADKLGINNYTYLNDSSGGAKMSTIAGYVQAVTTANVVTCLGGTNDFHQDTTLASFESTIRSMIATFRANNPDAMLILITPPKRWDETTNGLGLTLLDYINTMASVATDLSVPLLDLYNTDTGITSDNYTKYMLPDGVHFNEVGAEILASIIGVFVSDCQLVKRLSA